MPAHRITAISSKSKKTMIPRRTRNGERVSVHEVMQRMMHTSLHTGHRESLKAMAKERKRHAEDKTEAEMWARLEREESEMIKEEEEFGIMAHEITSLDAKAASPVIKKTTISFKHGQSHITETTLSQTQTGSNTPEPILYSSPADIYNQYAARAITKGWLHNISDCVL